MNRADIAHEITLDLLGADALDRHNYGYDDNALIAHVQKIILEHLEDYILISGTIFLHHKNTIQRVSVYCRCPFCSYRNISLMFLNQKCPLQEYPCDTPKVFGHLFL